MFPYIYNFFKEDICSNLILKVYALATQRTDLIYRAVLSGKASLSPEKTKNS